MSPQLSNVAPPSPKQTNMIRAVCKRLGVKPSREPTTEAEADWLIDELLRLERRRKRNPDPGVG